MTIHVSLMSGVSGSVTSMNAKLKIVKRNQDNVTQLLPGAKFTVRQMQLVDGNIVPVENGQRWVNYTTNSNGIIEIDKDANGNTVKPNTIYEIVETQAPQGFILDSTPHYFAVANDNDGVDGYENLAAYRDAGVTISYQGELYTYNALNEERLLTVTKQFEENGTPIGLQDGEYTFRLYEVNQDEGLIPKGEAKTLKIVNGKSKNTVVFNGIDAGKKYVVRELDDSGRRAEDSLYTISNSYFWVSYSGEDLDENGYVTFVGNDTAASVTVTNTLVQFYLPETGGMGTGPIYLTAVVLMLTSGLLLFLKKRIDLLYR